MKIDSEVCITATLHEIPIELIIFKQKRFIIQNNATIWWVFEET